MGKRAEGNKGKWNRRAEGKGGIVGWSWHLRDITETGKLVRKSGVRG